MRKIKIKITASRGDINKINNILLEQFDVVKKEDKIKNRHSSEYRQYIILKTKE